MKLLPAWRVYKRLLATNLQTILMYRADSLQAVGSSLLWGAFSFTSAFLITSQAPNIIGLSRFDLLLLTANYGIIIGFTHVLFTGGFQAFPETIHRGELDGYLLKPFNALFLLALGKPRITSLPRIFISMGISWLILHNSGITPSFLQYLGFFAAGGIAMLFPFAIYTLVNTFLIWNPTLSNLIDLSNNFVGTGRYPLAIARFVQPLAVLVFLPFLLIINIPTQILLGRTHAISLIAFLVVCIGSFIAARLFWRKTLRDYTGASG